MASYSPVTHVIFDLDGLILDTERIYKKRYEEILARYGKRLTPEIQLACLGRKDVDCAINIINSSKIPLTSEQFVKEVKSLQLESMANATVMPGVERLVHHLAQNGVPIAIATSSGEDSVALKLAKHKSLASLFHHIVMAGTDPEVKNGKPHPDVFQVCASRFPDKPSFEKCLVMEDAPSGAKGARAAGMQVVLVPEPFVPEEMTKEATLVLSSLEHFQPELFGLPKFVHI